MRPNTVMDARRQPLMPLIQRSYRRRQLQRQRTNPANGRVLDADNGTLSCEEIDSIIQVGRCLLHSEAMCDPRLKFIGSQRAKEFFFY